ncbi:flagellar motor switch protein FliM [Puerhibacterium puerhi]|uniref:flagellar motor switch protein FliM n=1 Tax=Puerhibacterium puerhi TaxID=2692623 RepID=UPI001F3D9E00|nr:flagellar motor switch protein FliM [Puerhibacterium puerhi]
MTVPRQQTVVRPVSRGARLAPTSEPVPYDFRRPLTMSRDHARHLEMAFERFGRQWATQLTARLRAVTEVVLEGVALRPYDEYVAALPAPTAVVVCAVGDTRSSAVLQLPLPMTLVWIDYLFGGTGRGDDRQDRELTEIEVTLLRGLLDHALADLPYAFASVMPLELEFRSIQYNPQFVQAIGASEPVVVATFSLRVGERADTATFMLPAEMLLTALRGAENGDGRTEADRRAAAAARADLDAAVHHVPVEVAVRFAPVTVQPRDVVALQVGDVVPLSHPSSQPLDVVVDDVVLARAAVGSHGSRLACKVVTVEERNA